MDQEDKKIIIVVVLFVIAFITGGIFWGKYNCYSIAKMMGVQSYHSLSTGCMIKYEDKWIPSGSFRSF